MFDADEILRAMHPLPLTPDDAALARAAEALITEAHGLLRALPADAHAAIDIKTGSPAKQWVWWHTRDYSAHDRAVLASHEPGLRAIAAKLRRLLVPGADEVNHPEVKIICRHDMEQSDVAGSLDISMYFDNALVRALPAARLPCSPLLEQLTALACITRGIREVDAEIRPEYPDQPVLAYRVECSIGDNCSTAFQVHAATPDGAVRLALRLAAAKHEMSDFITPRQRPVITVTEIQHILPSVDRCVGRVLAETADPFLTHHRCPQRGAHL